MSSKKERDLAIGLAVVLLIVGVMSYGAFSAKKPDEPVRVFYSTLGGKVVFDHKIHADDYGISCNDCHHHPEEDESAIRSCGDCHLKESDMPLAQSCLECHDMDEIESTEMLKQSDAFHQQCADCHEQNDAGPRGQDCSLCHLK
jgi:hypothetical protein